MRAFPILASSASFVGILALASTALAADPKSYTAALDQLPTDFGIVATINGKTLRALPAYTQAVTNLLSLDSKVKTGVGEVKTLCKIDLTTVVDDITLGVENQKKFALFINANGVDEKKVTSCIQALAKKEKNKTVTATASNYGTAKIVEYGVAGESDKIYLGFVGDVIVIVDKPQKKSVLEHALSGKGALAKSKAVTTWQGKVNTSALAFGLGLKEIVEPDVTMKGFAASADVAGGDVKVKASVDVKDAKQATKAVTDINKELGKPPKELAKSAKSFKVTANGSTVTLEGTVYESDYKALKP